MNIRSVLEAKKKIREFQASLILDMNLEHISRWKPNIIMYLCDNVVTSNFENMAPLQAQQQTSAKAMLQSE